MRVLTVSSLYPNAAQPNHGVFVENRMRRIHASGRAEVTVIAPVPWFPSRHPAFGAYATFAAIPPEETRHGIRILHPRYATLPKFGMRSQPAFYLRAIRRAAKALIAETGTFDVIDAHYFYPDGVAATNLAAELSLPSVVTARGSDISQIPFEAGYARDAVLGAAARATACVTVCAALRDAMIDLGADGGKITALRNGVDLDTFHVPPSKRPELKAALDIPREAPLMVSVGGLIERKGHHLAIDAVAARPGLHFLIAGAGPEREALQARIDGQGVGDRIRLVGSLPHAELATFYGAADASILTSSREGWANVLLESMACGTPVVATAIWGTPEVITATEAGTLVPERTASAIGEGIDRVLSAHIPRAATRRYAEMFSWDVTIEKLLQLFEDVTARSDKRALS